MISRSKRTFRIATSLLTASALILGSAPSFAEVVEEPAVEKPVITPTPIPGVGDWFKVPAPTIRGTIAVNQTISARMQPLPRPEYDFVRGLYVEQEWFKDGKLSRTTPNTMTIRLYKQDAGKALQVRSKYTDHGSEANGWAGKAYYTQLSAPVIISSLPVSEGKLTISGDPVNGQLLWAYETGWPSGHKTEYTWYADGKKLSDNTDTLLLNRNHVGKTITVEAKFIKVGYEKAVIKAKGVKVAPATLQSSKPSIAGTVQVGKKLTTSTGRWAGGAALKYQWTANGKTIKGATKSTYIPSADDRRKTLAVKVTGTKAGYKTTSKTSSQTKAVAAGALKTAKPSIFGKPKAGKTFKVTAGKWSKGTKLSYQWHANGKSIKGATKASYRVKKADRRKKISIKVTGKKSGYTTTSRTSSSVKIK